MDEDRPVNVNMLEGFNGVFSDTEPGDVPDGKTWRQLNMMSIRNGEIVSRGGLVDLELDVLE